MSKKAKRSTAGIAALATALGAAAIVHVSGALDSRDEDYDRERRVTIRWVVQLTRPGHVTVLSKSSMFGAQVITDTKAVDELASDIHLVKNEVRKVTVSGELPVASVRGSVTCFIYVNGKEVARQTKVVRAGENANGVKCEREVTG